MQTEPITRALQTLDKVGVGEEQRMATVKAIAEMQSPLLEAIEKMGSEVESRFEKMESRFEKMESRMDARFEKMESRITRLQVTVVGIFIPIIFISLRIFTFPN